MMIHEYKGLFVKYKIIDALELIIGAISLISSILSILVFFNDETKKLPLFAITAILALSIVILLKAIKLQTVANNRLKIFSESYHNLSHLVRNEYYNLKRFRDKGKLDHDKLMTSAKSTAQKSVDWIAQILKASTGEDVYVCLKYFPDNRSKNSSSKMLVKNLFVKTLAKSSNAPFDIDIDVIERVGDSTPLFFLMMERSSDFRVENIRHINKRLKSIGLAYYRDARPNWEDHYASIIAVPIRMRTKYIGNEKPSEGYDIVGFLFASSRSTSAFRKNDIDSYCHLLKGFADIMYSYIDRIDFYYDEITQNGGEL